MGQRRLKHILIVGSPLDPHVLCVSTKLREAGAFPLFLDLLDPGHFQVTLEAGRWIFFQDDRWIGSNNIVSVWNRWKSPIMGSGLPPLGDRAWRFIQREWASVIEALAISRLNIRWINPIDVERAAVNKVHQMATAHECGWKIPSSLVSNSPTSTKSFLSRRAPSIYKTLSGYYEAPDRTIFTNEVDWHRVSAETRKLGVAPCLFQRKIQKRYELRVTIVGSRIFSAAVDSQACTSSMLDWRRSQADVKWTRFPLPGTWAAKLLRLHRRLGLVFGAYDLIVDRRGVPWFLEVNPCGQWLWIEELLGLDISGALARTLM